MKIVGKNRVGGRIIEVRVPTPVYEEMREMQRMVREGEMPREPDAKQFFTAKILPWVNKDLGDFEPHMMLDDIWIRPMTAPEKPRVLRPQARSKKLIRPSGVEQRVFGKGRVTGS